MMNGRPLTVMKLLREKNFHECLSAEVLRVNFRLQNFLCGTIPPHKLRHCKLRRSWFPGAAKRTSISVWQSQLDAGIHELTKLYESITLNTENTPLNCQFIQ